MLVKNFLFAFKSLHFERTKDVGESEGINGAVYFYHELMDFQTNSQTRNCLAMWKIMFVSQEGTLIVLFISRDDFRVF